MTDRLMLFEVLPCTLLWHRALEHKFISSFTQRCLQARVSKEGKNYIVSPHHSEAHHFKVRGSNPRNRCSWSERALQQFKAPRCWPHFLQSEASEAHRTRAPVCAPLRKLSPTGLRQGREKHHEGPVVEPRPGSRPADAHATGRVRERDH